MNNPLIQNLLYHFRVATLVIYKGRKKYYLNAFGWGWTEKIFSSGNNGLLEGNEEDKVIPHVIYGEVLQYSGWRFYSPDKSDNCQL